MARARGGYSPDILAKRTFVRTFFSDMPDAVIFADRDRRILALNPAALAMFGYDPAELIGQRTAMLYADRRDYELAGAQHYNPDAPRRQAEYIQRYRRRDGEVFAAETTGAVVRGDDGETVGFLGIIREVWSTHDLHQILAELAAITAEPARRVDDSVPAILALGTRHLQQPYGVVERVAGGSYTIAYAVGPHGRIASAGSYPLEGSFCARTLASGGPVAFHEAPAGQAPEQAGYTSLRPESYIGAPLVVDGETCGTIHYSGPDVRHPFTEMDLALIRLLALAVANELSRARLNETEPSGQG